VNQTKEDFGNFSFKRKEEPDSHDDVAGKFHMLHEEKAS
jgi:hypothetical protein